MSDTGIPVDVCVIGAGPAGSAFAARLAGMGHKVVIVEKSDFPRPHVGESLTPAAWDLLDVIGARDFISSRVRIRKGPVVRVKWGSGEVRELRHSADHSPFTVDRGDFDSALLDLARAAGAKILQPAMARTLRRLQDRWEIELVDHCSPSRITARFLADASGRSRVLGGNPVRFPQRLLAIEGRWASAGTDGKTRIESGNHAWYWGAHLPDATFSAMVFVDLAHYAGPLLARHRLESLYGELLNRSELLRGLTKPTRPGPLMAHDASCYSDPNPIDRVSIRLGEAAFAIDPLSSAGVQKALQTALTGSIVANTILTDGNTEAAIDFYRDAQRRSVEQHQTWTEGFYGLTDVFGGPSGGRHTEESLESSGERRELSGSAWVRLADAARIVSLPCLVGDRVEVRGALSHPSLSRPVAYVGGVYLQPLLNDLSEWRSLQVVRDSWQRSVGTSQVAGIIQWLSSNGLLDVNMTRKE